MNVNMFTNPVVQRNLQTLEEFGVTVIPPDNGYLACGYTGAGKMPSEQVLLDYILRVIAKEKDLAGKRVLVTAGPTRESIDPVRFITNHSTGKMGYAVARQAMLRGAEVTLVSGPVSIDPPPFVRVVNVSSAKDMFEAVKVNFADADIIIKIGRRSFNPDEAHDRYSEMARREQARRTAYLRLLDGNREYARELARQAAKEKRRPDCGEFT